jgi:hypothetical protein
MRCLPALAALHAAGKTDFTAILQLPIFKSTDITRTLALFQHISHFLL